MKATLALVTDTHRNIEKACTKRRHRRHSGRDAAGHRGMERPNKGQEPSHTCSLNCVTEVAPWRLLSFERSEPRMREQWA